MGDKEQEQLKGILQCGAGFMELANTYWRIKQEKLSSTKHTESEPDEITSNKEPDVSVAAAEASKSKPEQCTSRRGSKTSEVAEEITPSVPSTSKALPDRSQSAFSAAPSASSTPTKEKSSSTNHTESEPDEITSNEEPDVSVAAAEASKSKPKQCTSRRGSKASEVAEETTPSVPSTSKGLPDKSQSTSPATPSGSSTPTKKKPGHVHLDLVDETLPADQTVDFHILKGSAASLSNIKEGHIIHAHQVMAVQHQKKWRGQVYDARSTTMLPPEGNGKEGAETVSKKFHFDGADLERVTELRQLIKEELSKTPLSPTPASQEGNVSGEERQIDRGYNSSVKTLAEIQSEGHYILYCKVVESHHKQGNTVLHVTDGTIPSDLITREKACSTDNRDRNAEVSRTVKVILKSETEMKFQDEFVEMIGIQAETIVDAYSGKSCLAFVLSKIQNISIIPATHTQAELINRRLQQMNKDANRPPSAQITDIVKREPNDQEIGNENSSSGHDVSGLEGLPENRIESERQESENEELEGNMKKRRRITESTEVQDSPDENAMQVSIRCIKSRGLEENMYLVEGVITQIEPPIKADNSRRKDIVSGYCSTCNTLSRYSSLIFNFETQKHTCPQCPVDKRKTVLLVFSLSFHVVDKTNEELVVRLCGESAMEFLGVTVNSYLRDPQIRKRVTDALLDLLPANEVQREPRKVKLRIQSCVDVSGMRYMIKKTYLTYNASE